MIIMIIKEIVCDMHYDERKTKFCKEQTCWERLCPYCAEDRHSGHNVVNFSSLLNEIRLSKDKFITENEKTLMKYKKLFIDLERFHKKFMEKDAKLIAKEKKLRVSLEEKLKSLRNTILTQRERTRKKIDSVMEDINASKVLLTQNVLEIERIIDKVLTDGQNTDIREFFNKCQKPALADPNKYHEMVDSAAKELEILQHIDQSISFKEFPLMSTTRRASPKPVEETSPNVELGDSRNQIKEANRSTSQRAQGNILRQTKSLISKLTSLGLKKTSKIIKSNVEEELINTRSNLDKLTIQVNKKKTKLDKLKTSLANTKNQIALLENRKEQLLKTNDSLKSSIEKQNKLFADAAKSIVLSPLRHKSRGHRRMLDLNKTTVLDNSVNELVKEDSTKITLLLKKLLKKHSHSFTVKEESLTAEEVIHLLDSLWPKPSRADSKPRSSQDNTKKESQAVRALELKVETLQNELR